MHNELKLIAKIKCGTESEKGRAKEKRQTVTEDRKSQGIGRPERRQRKHIKKRKDKCGRN